MDYNYIKELMRQIADKNPSDVTADDKAAVREYTSELGVQFSAGKSRCKACYIDAAILCWKAASKKEAEEQSATDERRYILVPDTDVIFGSIRVNEATLTDELAERIIARGFDKKYFVKC